VRSGSRSRCLKAREARAAFLAGKKPREARVQLLRRKPEVAPDTDELLRKAQAETSLPRVLAAKESGEANAPGSVDPEMARVLEKELRKPGDVTTILEERDRFEIFRLISATGETWKAEAVSFPKVGFDTWLAKTARIR
jgi:hypothetical protein